MATMASEHSSTAHGIRRIGLCRVSGKHLSQAENEPGVGIDSPLYRALVDAADARDERNAVLRAEYVAKLARHDWSHEFSDDGEVARRGRAQLRELRAMQQDIDRDFTLWDRHCHPACKGGRAYA